jgi:phenylacetate-CoA ligase
LALWSVIKETPGVLRFQAIQTSPDELKIRLEPKHAEECEAVWAHVYANTCDYLQKQGLDRIKIIRASEPPMRDSKSGKFRNIWVDKIVQ